MTPKQKRFADEYLIDLNATRAYKAAYPKVKNETAAVNGSRLLSNANVAAYVADQQKKRSERTQITQDRVLKELASIGFADVSDFAKVVEREYEAETDNADKDGEKEIKTYKCVEILPSDNVPADKRGAIAGIKQGANGIEIKLNDKVKALELIGRHLGMFTDKVQVEGAVPIVIAGEDDLEE